jgi:hypothetical protein
MLCVPTDKELTESVAMKSFVELSVVDPNWVEVVVSKNVTAVPARGGPHSCEET